MKQEAWKKRRAYTQTGICIFYTDDVKANHQQGFSQSQWRASKVHHLHQHKSQDGHIYKLYQPFSKNSWALDSMSQGGQLIVASFKAGCVQVFSEYRHNAWNNIFGVVKC